MNTLDFNAIKTAKLLKHVDYHMNSDEGILWVYMNPYPVPCVSPDLVEDIRRVQRILEVNDGHIPVSGQRIPVRYHVLDSHSPEVFSLGGDLAFFLESIRTQNRSAIEKYAVDCINAIYPIMVNFGLPLITISLVRGKALGGGFEIALSGDVIIAERSAQMGFPEILFNLFPGMGAYHMLSSRIGLNKAHSIITSGKLFQAEELFELGIVDVLVEDGCGEDAVYDYIRNCNKHWNSHYSIQSILGRLRNYDKDELMTVCSKTWVDAVFNLEERDIRTISRLIRSQQRYSYVENTVASNQATAF